MAILRPYQNDLKQLIYNDWASGVKNVLAVMPTGGGKTKMFCNVAQEMMRTHPSVIMVHRQELVSQICITLAEDKVPHNIIAPQPVIKSIIAAERLMLNRQYYDHNSPVTVVSVDTLNARFEKYKQWAEKIKLWITDEATHLLKTNKWGKAVDFFPNAIGLGVTATPQRLDKRGLGRHADGVFDTMQLGPSTRWLIDHKFLSKYQVAIPNSDYTQFLKKAGSGSDYSHDAMIEAANQSHIVGDVVDNYVKLALGKQAIVFADSIATAQKIETEFLQHKIPAKVLHGETDARERTQALIDFRDRVTRILINVDLFDEGLDVPGIEVVIMARPTMSVSKFLQQIGRGLRPAKGKEYALIIDHVGNVMGHGSNPGHGLPDRIRPWTLDRLVKRRDQTNLIRICINEMCNKVYDRLLWTCPYCGKEDTPASRAAGSTGREALSQVDGDLILLDPETLREFERETHLEDPGSVGSRVAAAAGAAAGMSAMEKQKERIRTQKELAEVIAKWAGKWRARGHTDRAIHKLFYAEYGMTITMALSEPRANMQSRIEEISCSL